MAPLFGASREGTSCLTTSTFGHGVAPTSCCWPKGLASQLGDSVDYPHAHYRGLATDIGRRESNTTERHTDPLSWRRRISDTLLRLVYHQSCHSTHTLMNDAILC